MHRLLVDGELVEGTLLPLGAPGHDGAGDRDHRRVMQVVQCGSLSAAERESTHAVDDRCG